MLFGPEINNDAFMKHVELLKNRYNNISIINLMTDNVEIEKKLSNELKNYIYQNKEKLEFLNYK